MDNDTRMFGNSQINTMQDEVMGGGDITRTSSPVMKNEELDSKTRILSDRDDARGVFYTQTISTTPTKGNTVKETIEEDINEFHGTLKGLAAEKFEVVCSQPPGMHIKK